METLVTVVVILLVPPAAEAKKAQARKSSVCNDTVSIEKISFGEWKLSVCRISMCCFLNNIGNN